ncbi:MAG: hypothetical protein ACJ76J_12540 [Thermoanaerobaculia bacterium]
MSWLFLAYLDPSAGSMMLQLILGGLAGVAIALRLFWARILTAVGLGRKKSDEPEEADPETRDGA